MLVIGVKADVCLRWNVCVCIWFGAARECVLVNGEGFLKACTKCKRVSFFFTGILLLNLTRSACFLRFLLCGYSAKQQHSGVCVCMGGSVWFDARAHVWQFCCLRFVLLSCPMYTMLYVYNMMHTRAMHHVVVGGVCVYSGFTWRWIARQRGRSSSWRVFCLVCVRVCLSVCINRVHARPAQATPYTRRARARVRAYRCRAHVAANTPRHRRDRRDRASPAVRRCTREFSPF